LPEFDPNYELVNSISSLDLAAGKAISHAPSQPGQKRQQQL
jgi:hypothetical protein